MGLTAERVGQRFASRASRRRILPTQHRRRWRQSRLESSTKSCSRSGEFHHSETAPSPSGKKLFSKWTKAARRHIARAARAEAAFHAKGTVTAGNSSQMSTGAAASVVMSAERAKASASKPLARYVSFATAGYKPEEMGLGPVFAIPKL